jgi:peptidyl-prolyl cis-trans isomerase D
MLQLLRGKKSGLLVKILLVLITIGFSFFGIESYFVANMNTGVAKVGDAEISQDQYRERFNQYRQRMLQMSNGALDASFFEQPEIRRQVLDQLVDEQVLLEANRKLGVVVPPTRVREEILKVPSFLVDGKFDPEQYKMVLATQGMSPLGFEERVRQDLGIRELPAQVDATALVTDAEVDTYLRLRDQRRDIRFVKIEKPAPQGSDVGDEEIDTWYKAHTAEFMVPERVALDYLELDAGKLDVDLSVDDSALMERYEKEKTRFVTSEQRLASHILIKVPGKGSPDDQKQALAKAEGISSELKAGKDFATLAKENSADLGSKNQGGDLGWLDKGTTDEAFESALFALAKDEVSAPILSSEGYHIIQLRDIRPGKTRSFDEVKEELAREHETTERDRVYAEKAGRLTDLTYADPSSLETAAKELGLTVQKTPLFGRTGGEGLASNPAIAKAAFSDSVLVQNNNSDPIDLGPNHIAVVRIAEHKPATPIPLDEVRDQVRSRIIAERVSKQAKEHADALLGELSAGKSLAALGLKVEEHKGIGRDAATVDGNLTAAAFAMPRPQSGQPSHRVVDLGGDSYALLELDNVVDGDPSSLDATSREAARNTLRQGAGAAVSRDFVAALRKSMKISISLDKLQDL